MHTWSELFLFISFNTVWHHTSLVVRNIEINNFTISQKQSQRLNNTMDHVNSQANSLLAHFTPLLSLPDWNLCLCCPRSQSPGQCCCKLNHLGSLFLFIKLASISLGLPVFSPRLDVFAGKLLSPGSVVHEANSGSSAHIGVIPPAPGQKTSSSISPKLLC